MKKHTKNTQPKETIGKKVKYICNEKIHMPYFANQLTWSRDTRVISPAGMITHYQIV